MRAERDAKELAVGHHDGKRSRSRMNFSRPGGPLSMTRGYAELRALVQESSNTASRYTMVCVVLPHTAIHINSCGPFGRLIDTDRLEHTEIDEDIAFQDRSYRTTDIRILLLKLIV